MIFNAIFVAVPAFNLVEPAKISGPVSNLISISETKDESVEGNQLHKIVFEGELKQTFKKARRSKKRKK